MPKKEIQNESHDWLADAAESLVRYYFAKTGRYYTFGSSKWGADCVLQDKKTGKMLTVEVKSTDSNRTHAYLCRSLKKKLAKMELRSRPDMYAEVRLKEDSRDCNSMKIEICFWKINKDNSCLGKILFKGDAVNSGK